ncbi:MAG: 50S ribosomal protein L25/general stress protein Ctc [Casimicrobiaceae bacterium]|nr:50S ribosomal protein L25/general stress protein Ctc [Casimicrobiaceae bacterium]MCX8097420.1 50S ribosomal protein L25/general stress protein Ctc [Casimicrobiaceae bacterium]MDW8312054.1 50S ribosomal protein L25/general stress protein Ctc [Burkholderiales bacterium]
MTTHFTAFVRTTEGSSASRRLRARGRVPGIVYGGAAKPQLIELDHNALWHALKREEFHSSILTMTLGESQSQVLLRDVQYHPYKPQVLHVDFQRVDPDKTLRMKVPVHFINQEISPAVKLSGAVVNHVLTEVEIACLPKDLPRFIEVDLKDLKAGESIHASDVKLPEGVSFVFHGRNKDVVFATASVVAEEVVETAAPQATEVAATKQKEPAAAPAPGKDEKKKK